MRPRNVLLVLLIVAASLSLAGCSAVAGLVGVGPPKTTLSITNKITSLPAGQTYQFSIAEQHDQGTGFTLTLNGQGTLLQNGFSAVYIAPASPPSPNSVTVTATAANGSNVSDSDTFTITAASGPVVSISPTTFTVTGGGSAVTLNVTVSQDNPSDTLTGGVSGSPACNSSCGSFGPLNGTPGGGTYTVDFIPGRSITTTTLQQVQVFSSLASSTPGTAYVTENAGTAACALSGEQVAFLLTGSDSTGLAVLVGSVSVASDGSVTGEYDLADGAAASNPKTVASGKCSAGTVANTGTLTLTNSGTTRTFNFSMRSNLAFGHIVETDATATLAGSIQAQTSPSVFGGGSYAFGLVGDSTSPASRVAAVGTLCSNSNFDLTFLQADIDVNDAIDSSLSGTGSYSAPDADGRSTTGAAPWSFSDGSSMDLTLYVVDNTQAFAVVTGGKTSSGAPLPLIAGEMTGVPGAACPQQSGSFNNSSLATSIFIAKGEPSGTIAAQAGLVTNVNPAAGTLTFTLDENQGGTSGFISGQAATYSISGAGRGMVTTTNGKGQQNQSILYLDGNGNAYLIGGAPGTFFGTVLAQGGQTTPVTGDYASGALFIPPADEAFGSSKPATLPATEISVDDTALSFTDQATGGSSGNYTLDSNNPGRGTATLNNNATFGDTSIVFYVVGGHRILVMGLTSATPSLLDLRR
jgi:hypothetical protein